MRVNLINGNGCLCDTCGRKVLPFENITVKCQKTVKGANYSKVSSDITQKQISKFHLCEKCYNKLESLLRSNIDKVEDKALYY